MMSYSFGINSSEQPNHKVKHFYGRSADGADICGWCGMTRLYHETGTLTPYCMGAPKYKVDAWRADEDLRIARETRNDISRRNTYYRKFWE